MSDKRIFRSFVSLLISVGIGLPLPALAQQQPPPRMGLMGGAFPRSSNDANVRINGTLTRLKIEGRDVTVTTTEVNLDNAEAIADSMVASSPDNTIFAVSDDGKDELLGLIQKKPWYRRVADKIMPMARVEDSAVLQSDVVPLSYRQKLLGFFRNEREQRKEEWKGVAYSIAIGGVTGAFNYMSSGHLSEASQAFGAAFLFAMLMTTGEHQWSKYLKSSRSLALFVASAGGRLKYRDQVQKAIATTGEISATMVVNAMYALTMQFIDGSASFSSWQAGKESIFAATMMAYQINGQVIDSTLHRWRRSGMLTQQTINKYMITPSILLGGAIIDALNLNHVPNVTYVSGTIVGAFIAYAYGGETFENKYKMMKQAYADFTARNRGQFFRPVARAATVCSNLLAGSPAPDKKPLMAPISFAYYAR